MIATTEPLPEWNITPKRRPRKADKGHTLVRMATKRIEDGIYYASPRRAWAECQCGKKMTTRGGGLGAVLYAHERHQRTERAKAKAAK